MKVELLFYFYFIILPWLILFFVGGFFLLKTEYGSAGGVHREGRNKRQKENKFLTVNKKIEREN